MSVDIHDVIMCATFCDDQLRGSGVARGRISRFPIDLRRRPYNTLALPCVCVMQRIVSLLHVRVRSFHKELFSCSCYSLTHLFRLTEICLGICSTATVPAEVNAPLLLSASAFVRLSMTQQKNRNITNTKIEME